MRLSDLSGPLQINVTNYVRTNSTKQCYTRVHRPRSAQQVCFPFGFMFLDATVNCESVHKALRTRQHRLSHSVASHQNRSQRPPQSAPRKGFLRMTPSLRVRFYVAPLRTSSPRQRVRDFVQRALRKKRTQRQREEHLSVSGRIYL